MKLSVFCGVSVDGFLARTNHTFDFLDSGEQVPHGYDEFYSGVDVVVIGRNTFKVVQAFGTWPYGQKLVVVLSGRLLDLSSVKGAWSSRCPANRPQSSRGSAHAAANTHISTAASPSSDSWRPVSSTG